MKFSLNKKAILLIVCIAVVVGLMATAVYGIGIHDLIETQYEEHSVNIARLVAVEIDPQQLRNVRDAVLEIYNQTEDKVRSDRWGTPEFEAYVAKYASVADTEDFRSLRDSLRRMQDVLDVDCLYTTWVDVENECYVYLADAAYEDPCPPGCIDPVYLDNAAEKLKDLDNAFFPNVTNTPEYGWIAATAMPVYGDGKEIIAFACVDISMNDVMAKHYRFLIAAVLIFLGVTALACVIGILVVNKVLVKPIKQLSEAAAQYAQNRQYGNVFSGLNLSRGDEIGMLAESMARMEEDINGYIGSLEKTTGDLIAAREHAEQMDRVANIDPLTKVRNKRAYGVEVKRLNENTQPYGIVMIDLNGLKQINDTYGHDKGDVSINALCQIVCGIFKHSPVFRVGGDEFVVILEKSDLNDREALIRSLEEIFRKNRDDLSAEPWERVTAALGCAVFDPEQDENADSVLVRADEAMYEQKKALKLENGAAGNKPEGD
ncbi:MAG: diguanylate cyclase [Clostridia bacterium]|nr:diguanylate cyclase [Clostridia bacterium]